MIINFCNTISPKSVFWAHSQSVWSCFQQNTNSPLLFRDLIHLIPEVWILQPCLPVFYSSKLESYIFLSFWKERGDRPVCPTLATLLLIQGSGLWHPCVSKEFIYHVHLLSPKTSWKLLNFPRLQPFSSCTPPAKDGARNCSKVVRLCETR